MRKILVLLAVLATGCHVQTMDAQCPRPVDVAPLAAPATPEPAPGGDPQPAPVVVQEQPEVVDVPAAPPGEAVPSVDVFYTELAQYGSWYDDAEYGRVFAPASADYVPYSDGQWEYTAQGWNWASNEPFGWAVCHYGRWVHRDRWVWVPDTVWGPAWVEWRVSDGYIGWAPLAAPALVATAYVTPVYAWRFVEPRAIFETNLRSRYVPADRVGVIVRTSHPVKRYARTPQGGSYAAGPSPEYMRDHHVAVQTVTARERDMGRIGARERQDLERHAEERRRAEMERWRVESQRRAEEQARQAAAKRAAEEQARQEAARHAAEEHARQEATQRVAFEQQQRAMAAQQQQQQQLAQQQAAQRAQQQQQLAQQQAAQQAAQRAAYEQQQRAIAAQQQQAAQQQAVQRAAYEQQQRAIAAQQQQQQLAQQQAQAQAARRVAQPQPQPQPAPQKQPPQAQQKKR